MHGLCGLFPREMGMGRWPSAAWRGTELPLLSRVLLLSSLCCADLSQLWVYVEKQPPGFNF